MEPENNESLQKAKNKRVLYLFFATFFLSMFIVGFLIKALSPNVDVEIGDDSSDQITEETPDEAESASSAVDDRLKWIQFEDNMPGVSKRLGEQNAQTEDDAQAQKDKIKEFKNPASTQNSQDGTTVKKLTPPVPTSSEAIRHSTSATEPLRMSKVIVGYYSSLDQAISVQNRLIDSDLNISPFIKQVNGYYVVQAGSYANRQKAQTLHSQISSMGLPAKLIAE
ncbi:MAG: SPOR domain-containing protein [Candidatus Gastranaerophilales bacterium]|nr:SPOR domain-containing protein [Candidatus Gastranaerophilales bacterium]